MIKEVIFFSYGDSRLASTWSNVPYLFTKTLIDKGIVVRRINIGPNKYINALYNRITRPILNIFYKNHSWTYLRSSFFERITEIKIKNAVRKYKNADLCIFTNFDYYNKYNNVPTLLFCDWTYEVMVSRKGMKSYSFEESFIKRQEIVINKAEYVVSLFPICADLMKIRYPNANINYLNRNVINNLYEKIIDKDLIKNKVSEKSIIFIGNKKYLDGAHKTVQAFKLVCEQIPNIKLNIIGLNSCDLGVLPANVECYGYLNKSIDKERNLYYKLLTGASVFVNPTPVWGGYSVYAQKWHL